MSRATDFADQLESDALMSGLSRREHLDYRIDAAAELRNLDAINAGLVEALRAIVSAWEYGISYSDVRNEIGNARAAIAEAEAQQ